MSNAAVECSAQFTLDLVVRQAAAEFSKPDAFRWSTTADGAHYLLFEALASGTRLRFAWSLLPCDANTFYAIVVRSLLANMLNAQHQCEQLLQNVVQLKKRLADHVLHCGAEADLPALPFMQCDRQQSFRQRYQMRNDAFYELLNGKEAVQQRDVLMLQEMCGLMADTKLDCDDAADGVEVAGVAAAAAASVLSSSSSTAAKEERPTSVTTTTTTPSKGNCAKRKLEQRKLQQKSPMKLKYEDEDDELD